MTENNQNQDFNSTEQNIESEENLNSDVDASTTTPTHESTSPSNQTASQNDEFKAKYEDMQNKYLRLYADYENYKREVIAQKSQDERKLRKQIITTAILPLLDHLKLATDYAPKTDDEKLQKYIQSVENILKNSIQDIQKVGAIIIIPEIGQSFDQNTMEAIQALPSDGQMPAHCVISVVSFGLQIENIVIQPARVIISE
jgi:molecular chaperone GrpE